MLRPFEDQLLNRSGVMMSDNGISLAPKSNFSRFQHPGRQIGLRSQISHERPFSGDQYHAWNEPSHPAFPPRWKVQSFTD